MNCRSAKSWNSQRTSNWLLLDFFLTSIVKAEPWIMPMYYIDRRGNDTGLIGDWLHCKKIRDPVCLTAAEAEEERWRLQTSERFTCQPVFSCCSLQCELDGNYSAGVLLLSTGWSSGCKWDLKQVPLGIFQLFCFKQQNNFNRSKQLDNKVGTQPVAFSRYGARFFPVELVWSKAELNVLC